MATYGRPRPNRSAAGLAGFSTDNLDRVIMTAATAANE
jgi:hypothetical protein